MPFGYLALLAATLLVEIPIATGLAGSGRRRETVLAALALNLITHPLATALTWLSPAAWPLAELGVFAVEGVGYRELAGLSLARALVLSLVANVVSAGLGLVLFAA